MKQKINLDTIYQPSENVVSRDVCGEFIIIPITSGVGDMEDAIFTLNETGRAVWDKMDGKRSLKEVIEDLKLEFEGPEKDIEKDVSGIIEELLKRKMIDAI